MFFGKNVDKYEYIFPVQVNFINEKNNPRNYDYICEMILIFDTIKKEGLKYNKF